MSTVPSTEVVQGGGGSDTASAGRSSAGVSGLTAFTLRLTRARFSSRSGESLLYGASVLASTVCSLIAFTVAGGTWMFYQRSAHPSGILAQLAQDPTFVMILSFYVGLAALACALIVPSLVSLSAAGAQLGARGRERRLASLRLLGLSSGDVTRMALFDALVQTAAGTLLGFVAYLVTVPLWQRISFQSMPIGAGEMLLPWWLGLLVAGVLVALGMVASAWGLRQVRISPLGVSQRTTSPAVRVWRLVALVVVVVAGMVVMPMLKVKGSGSALFVVSGIVVLLLLAINVAGPWILQLLARLLAHAPSPALLTAARRITASPKATWGRVSTIGVLAFIGGYLANLPLAYDAANAGNDAQRSFMQQAQGDFTVGAFITLACGFALTATSLLITQASATIERAEQSRALHKVGVPSSFALRVMWLETFGPLLASTLLGGGLGAMMAAPLAAQVRNSGLENGGTGLVAMVVVMAGGLLVAALALLPSHPLQHRIVAAEQRRND